MDILQNPMIIVPVVIILLLALAVIAVSSRYRIARSDEAIVVTGRGGKKSVTNPETGEQTTDLSGQKVVIAGGTFVIPFIQSADKISLRSRRIPLQIREVQSANNVRLNIEGVAMIKVGGTEGMVRAAAQRFLGQQDQIEDFSIETLNGSLRAIIGGMTVEQIIRDRAALASAVRDEAETSLSNQGLVIDTLQIQSVSDDKGYIDNLARPEQARAEQEAKIAEASAHRLAAQKEAEAQQQIADAEKELALKRAMIKAETDQAAANAAAAGPLAKAAQDQNVIAAEEQVATRQAELTARQLESTVNKPAEAEKYRKIQEAEADKTAQIAHAQAEAETTKLKADAELAARRAQAEAVKLEGEAQAAAIREIGLAEAESQTKKAEAFQKYNDAAMSQMVIDVLPKIAAELAAPMSSIKDMTVISTEGASAVPKMMMNNLSQLNAMVKGATGFDLEEMMGKIDKSSHKNLVVRPEDSPEL